MEPKPGCDHKIDRHASRPHQPIGGASLQKGGNHYNCQKQAGCLIRMKIKRHGSIHHPTNDDTPRQNKCRHLDGTSHRHANNQIHLVPVRKDNRGNLFGNVRKEGKDDHRGEDFAQMNLLCKPFNGVHQNIAHSRNRKRNYEKPQNTDAKGDFCLFFVTTLRDGNRWRRS